MYPKTVRNSTARKSCRVLRGFFLGAWGDEATDALPSPVGGNGVGGEEVFGEADVATGACSEGGGGVLGIFSGVLDGSAGLVEDRVLTCVLGTTVSSTFFPSAKCL